MNVHSISLEVMQIESSDLCLFNTENLYKNKYDYSYQHRDFKLFNSSDHVLLIFKYNYRDPDVLIFFIFGIELSFL